MGLSKLNPQSLCSINKDMDDNECTMGLPKPLNIQSSSLTIVQPVSTEDTAMMKWHIKAYIFVLQVFLDTDAEVVDYEN